MAIVNSYVSHYQRVYYTFIYPFIHYLSMVVGYLPLLTTILPLLTIGYMY